ncbi:hypothetical protein [Agromyces sp. SYSU T00194]|uniref:hypothetical protein n=1 Tax=Agromyces chitinivorans TaxID=3158560 RepID=UPI0033946DAC
MLLPFLLVGGAGLLLLVISLLLGDLFDHLDFGDGFISATALGVGGVVFGAAGALTLSWGLDVGWAYVLAVVLALVAYVLSVLLVRRLAASSDGAPASAVGLAGYTTAPVGLTGGEVSLDGPGEIERRLAFADEDIAAGVRIRVVDHVGARVKVAPE